MKDTSATSVLEFDNAHDVMTQQNSVGFDSNSFFGCGVNNFRCHKVRP